MLESTNVADEVLDGGFISSNWTYVVLQERMTKIEVLQIDRYINEDIEKACSIGLMLVVLDILNPYGHWTALT